MRLLPLAILSAIGLSTSAMAEEPEALDIALGDICPSFIQGTVLDDEGLLTSEVVKGWVAKGFYAEAAPGDYWIMLHHDESEPRIDLKLNDDEQGKRTCEAHIMLANSDAAMARVRGYYRDAGLAIEDQPPSSSRPAFTVSDADGNPLVRAEAMHGMVRIVMRQP
ncbi:hypothetical protein SZ64_02735 [Erythrobacter sp. SG61-1L]|uniref:hypothetical protein n=1 Tax=Erythrobacter sp. SG61-1L TaxID=1603897 RepID=UPI0006C8EFB6|nr:hypothetical protein [Erythrobacter sp. SG61-1L]KPL67105.1 hypothetical protein SZ64_02735 [Erythrobacter sp. SG61-1L]